MPVRFQVDSDFYDHPKTIGMSSDAYKLWTRAGSYSANKLTDGSLATPRRQPRRPTTRLLRHAPETHNHEGEPVKICFIDTETTSLRPDRRAWEIAIIIRDTDTGTEAEHEWMLNGAELELENANLNSLKIGHFYERHPEYSGEHHKKPWTPWNVHNEYSTAIQIEQLTRGAIWVGAVPDFDTHVLGKMLRRQGLAPAWHYHLVDVETLAAGARRQPPPWGFDDLLAAYGLAYAEADRHTALGDARMVRDLYDAVLKQIPTAKEN